MKKSDLCDRTKPSREIYPQTLSVSDTATERLLGPDEMLRHTSAGSFPRCPLIDSAESKVSAGSRSVWFHEAIV